MEVGGVATGVNLHDWFHFAQTYHRLTCMVQWEACEGETYTEDGFSRMSFFAPFYQWWMAQHWSVGVLVLLPVALGLSALRLIELAIWNPVAAVATIAVVGWSLRAKSSGKIA